ncbi:hypothetical protein ENUP19_0096G0003 [Entamoeba nuttalli]|uniref:Ubiquitin-conjugating enzyme family protein n=2 Tax=Entamoeba nuttalli TaxID=412467 RepID=K2HFN2_ENTNP|nr:hypothetical protein ENU1_049600 [Entamoeba nuttalli P19]EKE41624.1 hypothetical protein ENU1_049600 [Entamoeba nuttalli P19]|eukprot:XP_008856042.1 hypothetical protein ENU1_049600 [Entamoeba nuttalli P19]
MSVKKPRFAVLLEDCENGQHGNLTFVSYFLQNEDDTSLSNWNGEFLFKDGSSLSFTVKCSEQYPAEVPEITFKKVPRCTSKIQFNRNTISPVSQICKDWLNIDYNKRNLDALFTLIHDNLK